MRADTKIVFEMFDVDSKTQSALACTQSKTDINGLKNEKADTANYATTEPDGFYLDGSYKISENALPVGLYSDTMSKSDGLFENPVVLTISFAARISSTGITMYFPQNDLPGRLHIQWFKQGKAFKDGVFIPDSRVYFCSGNAEDYDSLKITFYGTATPGHYLKLRGIDYGQALVFTGDKIVRSNTVQEVDLLCDEISINTLNFTVEDKDRLFSVVSDNSVFFAAQENQKVSVYTKIAGEEQSIGVFYLSSITSSGVTAVFKAVDAIGLLESDDKLTEKYYNTTFNRYIAEILNGYKYSVEESLKNLPVIGYMPQITKREALQQACFALGAVADTQGGDVIKIYKLDNRPSKLVTASGVFTGGQVDNIKAYGKISVTAHSFTQSGDDVPVVHTVQAGKKARNAISVENAVFVNGDNVTSVIERLKYYYNQQVTYKFSLPLDENYKLGDMIMAYLQGGYIKGNIESLEINLSGGLVATITVRGYVFNYTNASYAGELYTGERGGADVVATDL